MRTRTTIAASVVALLATTTLASSHREGPFITKYPQADGTDFYAFMSYEPGREEFVTLIANYVPVQAAYGGPNYFPLDSQALYEILLDTDGDARENLTFQFRFFDDLPAGGHLTLDVGGTPITTVLRNIGTLAPGNEAGLDHRESYTLDVVVGDRRSGTRAAVTDAATGATRLRKPFDYAGTKSFGGPGRYSTYAASFVYDINVPGCRIPGRVFVGQRNEAFKISLGEVFDLVNFVPIEGDSAPGAGDAGGFPGGVTQDPARNILARDNVTSLALELHRSCLVGAEPIIGAWTAASLPQAAVLNPVATFEKPEVGGGAFTQISRLSAPLVNELVIGYDNKDRFNSSEPIDDGQFAPFVTNPVLPAILDTLFRDAVNSTLGAGNPQFTPIANLAPSNFPRSDLVAAFLTGFAGLNRFTNPTPGEMLRLNTTIAPTPREAQHPLGVAGGDLAGFPNGRRPGDDSVDIALRVVMGALCHPVPIGDDGAPMNLGLCLPSDAPVGNVPFTDGAPLTARDLDNAFPYLLTPYPGSPVNAPLPQPSN